VSEQAQDNVYEMLWDCHVCGTEKLLGQTHRHCPNCGSAQDPAARYFPSDEEKVAVHDHVFYGKDLICSSCSTPNAANATFCMQCGAPLENAEKATTLDEQMVGAGQVAQSTGPRDEVKERFDAEMARVEEEEKPRSKLPFIIGGVVVIAIAFVLVLLFAKPEATVLVTGHSWDRVINIEDYDRRSESGWRDAVPSDGYSLSCQQRQRSTRQVPDGETCSTRRVDQGDGTFREEQVCETRYREEPIFDDFCDYTVDRWAYSRKVEASGGSLNDPPYWPETNITRTGDCYGCEREGQQKEETYRLHFTDDDSNPYECDLDQATWEGIGVETRWTVQIAVVTKRPDCSALEPAS
jgi:hypothetical protein